MKEKALLITLKAVCLLYWIYGSIGAVVIINLAEGSAKEANRLLLTILGLPTSFIGIAVYYLLDIFAQAETFPADIWTLIAWGCLVVNGWLAYKLATRLLGRKRNRDRM